jgi:ectoine hydroxylase-related dioxygenase (phytanoyl-CoA dioxygenase family)
MMDAVSVPHDDTQVRDRARFLSDRGALNLPWVESPFFERLVEASELSADARQLARDFREQGYVMLEDCVEPELIDALTGAYDWLFDPATRFQAPRWAKSVLEADRARKQDAWCVCPPVKALAVHPRVLETLQLLYGRPAIPFQTLNFLRGTEQSLHSDAFHFSSLPARFMCGAWVALEDITERNGPLRYVRGSHRLHDVQLADLGLWAGQPAHGLGRNYEVFEAYIQALLETHDLRVEQLTCKRGTVFVWASHLLHGGAPILDRSTTRMSQVTHYYFEDCVYYTPAYSDTPLGEVFLRNVHDVRTGRQVPHGLNGRRMYALPGTGERSRIGPVDAPESEAYLPAGARFDKLRRAALRLARRIERTWGR